MKYYVITNGGELFLKEELPLENALWIYNPKVAMRFKTKREASEVAKQLNNRANWNIVKAKVVKMED